MDQIDDLLTRGVENIIPGKSELDKLLRSDKKLNIYLGIDPTATRIHIGNAVPLRKLKAFVDLGHNVTFLIGDFTALIGDTSDKDSERPSLSYEQIQENFKTYKSQAEKIIDFSKVKLAFNSDWLKKLDFSEIVKLCQHFSAGDFVSRELIKKRLNEGKKVGLHELLYPVMQGYDSYFLDTDIQIGGTDQTFNMQAGRILQKDLRGKDSHVLAMGFLEGTDGRKMSKTWNNAIWLDDSPTDMYGKVMSLKDDLIISYFTLATNLSIDEIEVKKAKLKTGTNPMEVKKELAFTIVRELHSEDAALQAGISWELAHQRDQAPLDSDVTEIKLNKTSWDPIDLLVEIGAAKSKSQAKELAKNRALKYLRGSGTFTVHEDWQSGLILQDGDIIKVGDKFFRKIKTG